MGCITSTCLYSDTGEGKTVQAGSWARWVKKVTGKKTLMYTAEYGNIGSIEDIIDAGLIDVIDVGSLPNPAESIDFASKGHLRSGDKWNPFSPTIFDMYGGIIHEGGTAYGECLLEELKVKGAANEIVAAEKAPQQYTSGALRVAGANPTYYGIAQGRLRTAVNNSLKLPVHILWTFRELKTEDEEGVSGYKEIYGPQLVGKAATPHVPAWFGRTIHLDLIREKDGKTVRKAFFKTHFSEGNKVPYVANPRLPASVESEMPSEIVLSKDTMIWAMDKFIELREKAKKMVLDSSPSKS